MTKPGNDLVAEIGALGNHLQVIIHTHGEVYRCVLVPIKTCYTEVPFVASHSLQAAAEQVILLLT